MDGKVGILFENNENNGLFKKLRDFKKLEKNEIYEKKKVLAKKNSVKFSMFRHFLSLKNIIEKKLVLFQVYLNNYLNLFLKSNLSKFFLAKINFFLAFFYFHNNK